MARPTVRPAVSAVSRARRPRRRRVRSCAPVAGCGRAGRGRGEPGVHHRGGAIGFVGECWAELQKVDWPNQKQVITGSVVVLVACTIVGTYLWIIDLIIKPLINNVLIG